MTKSDHRVSAKGTATKTVESEMQASAPAGQTQSLQNDDILKNPGQESEENKKEDDGAKHTKEEDQETFEILDSVNEEMIDGNKESISETLIPEREYSQSLHEESFQVLDSIETEGSEDSRFTSEEDSTEKNLTKEDVREVDKSNEKSAVDDLEKANDENQNEEQPPADSDEKGSPSNPDSDVNELETFKVLDSIDDQTEMEDDEKKTDILVEQASKEVPESDGENRETNKKEDEGARQDGRQSKRCRPRKRAPEEKISPTTQDKMVKKYETRTKTDTTAEVPDKGSEEMVYEIVDSVEDKPVQDTKTTESTSRKRSTRGKRDDKEGSVKPVGDEEAAYKTLDSVGDETCIDEPTIMTRSTRGRRLAKKDDPNESTPTRRRHTPARDTREKTPTKESLPTKKHDVREVSEEAASYEILDSVEDEVKDVQPVVRRRGRPRKDAKSTKKDSLTLKKVVKCESVADEEEPTYQILDSVEDDTTDEQPPTEQCKSKRKDKTLESPSLTEQLKEEQEEDEPVYQIVDSVEEEEDPVQEEPVTQVSKRGRKERRKTKRESGPEEKVSAETPPCGTTTVKVSEQIPVMMDSLSEKGDVLGDTAATEEHKKQTSPEESDRATSLVNLDEVSEEEEDYPDDTVEEEQLRRKQASSKEKQVANERGKGQEKRTTTEEEEGERRSRSSGSRAGRIDKGGTGREEEEKVEIDTKELVTLDEVGADEDGEEITVGEMQSLITLDEIAEEEEEGKAEQKTLEANQTCEDESVDFLNPEVRLTLKCLFHCKTHFGHVE